MAALDDPLRRHLDKKYAKILAETLDLGTVGDLLRLYPRRYVERDEVTDLAALAVGADVTVLATVVKVEHKRNQNRRGSRCEVTIGDGRSTLLLTFFNQSWRAQQLPPGCQALFVGTVSEFNRRRQLTHPDYAKLDGPADKIEELAGYTGGLLPVYPPSGTLRTWTITRCVRVLLDTLAEVDDPLPADLRSRHRLLPLAAAWRSIHLPTSWADVERARTRLRWDEAFVLQAALAQRRAAARRLPAPPDRRAPTGWEPPSTPDCRSRSPAGSARWATCSVPNSAAIIRCTDCCRVRWGRARRSSRCGRCWPSSTRAARPPCWHPPKCWPPSTSGHCGSCSVRWERPGRWVARSSPPRWSW